MLDRAPQKIVDRKRAENWMDLPFEHSGEFRADKLESEAVSCSAASYKALNLKTSGLVFKISLINMAFVICLTSALLVLVVPLKNCGPSS